MNGEKLWYRVGFVLGVLMAADVYTGKRHDENDRFAVLAGQGTGLWNLGPPRADWYEDAIPTETPEPTPHGMILSPPASSDGCDINTDPYGCDMGDMNNAAAQGKPECVLD